MFKSILLSQKYYTICSGCMELIRIELTLYGIVVKRGMVNWV